MTNDDDDDDGNDGRDDDDGDYDNDIINEDDARPINNKKPRDDDDQPQQHASNDFDMLAELLPWLFGNDVDDVDLFLENLFPQSGAGRPSDFLKQSLSFLQLAAAPHPQMTFRFTKVYKSSSWATQTQPSAKTIVIKIIHINSWMK